VDGFEEVVAQIHGAPLAPAGWSPALDGVGRLLGADVMQLSIGGADRIGFAASSSTVDAATLTRLQAGYLAQAENISVLRSLPSMPVGVPVLREWFMDDAAFVRDPMYRDLMAPLDLFHVAVLCVERGADGFALLGANRRRSAGVFGEAELALEQRLGLHLRVAVATQRRLGLLERQAAALGDVLDQLDSGVLLLDGTGRVLRANVRAEAILRERDGLILAKARLGALRPTDNTALTKLIAAAVATGSGKATAPGGALAVERPSGRRAFAVLVAPLRRGTALSYTGDAAAVVFVGDPDAGDDLPAAHLRALYGLTAREAELALAIVTGEGLQAASDRLGMSMGTAKTHLAHVFAKTDTARQGELVRVLLRAAAGRRPDWPVPAAFAG
jgi:DNA-binding CsgD family transcriptional regulator